MGKKVVGKKSAAVGIMYGLVGAFFLFGAGVVLAEMNGPDKLIPLLFVGIFLVVDGVILYQYMKTPSDAIILNADRSIVLPGYGVTLSMSEVMEISFRRAKARGIRYKWGKVMIRTSVQTYTVRYLSQCEQVAETLLQEMRAYRNPAV